VYGFKSLRGSKINLNKKAMDINYILLIALIGLCVANFIQGKRLRLTVDQRDTAIKAAELAADANDKLIESMKNSVIAVTKIAHQRDEKVRELDALYKRASKLSVDLKDCKAKKLEGHEDS
jgi:cell division protein FtsB